MAYVKDGDVIVQGATHCFDPTCNRDHRYVVEGPFTWRVHKEEEG